MRAQGITALLLSGAAICVVGAAGPAAAGDVFVQGFVLAYQTDPASVPDDPFAAIGMLEEDDLKKLRGGDANIIIDSNKTTTATTNGGGDTIIDSFKTINTTTANNTSTATFDHVDVSAGGNVIGGSVSFSDNAMGHFAGPLTMAFGTAPGTNVIANTSMSVTWVPTPAAP